MRYAISRAGQYDIQAKLTWMVDSLFLQSDCTRAREVTGDVHSEVNEKGDIWSDKEP